MGKDIHTPAVNRLFNAILTLKSVEECYQFFEDVCTIQELVAISQRFEVAEMLTQKKTYLDIAEKTGASTATISRVNRSLTYGNDGYTLVLKRMAEAAAETTAEPDEKVTQEQVDAAKQAIYDSVQAQVDEIMAKYEAGTPFADLIAEYGTDPSMTQDPNKTDGYAVHADSILWDPAFTAGAMGLQKVGDVSEPVLGTYGIHLLHYTRDIPAGAVELTEELRAQLKEELLSEKENTLVSEMMEGWMASAEIIYTEEGQAILDAMKEEEAATVETTEATEETLADGE